jgi:transposase
MSKTLYVGIDAHAKDNVCCFLDQEGSKVINVFSVNNNLTGAKELEERIDLVMKEHMFGELKIATEAVSFLDLHIVDYLASSEILAKYSPSIYQFNPKITHGFKRAYPDKDKTDADDAFVIADRLRFGRLPEPYEDSQPYFPLKRLTRYRYHLVRTIGREKNYFLTHLFLKYSSFNDIKPFSNVFGKAGIATITEFFSSDELASISIEELTEFLIQEGKNRFKDVKAVAEKVKQVARESYRIRPTLVNSVNLILASTIENIRALTSALKEVDEAIANEFKAFPNTLESVKGLGPVYSAGIFAEIGNIQRFSSQAKLAKFAGLTWRKTSSGNFEAEETHMTKTGNQYLRYYLIEAANSLKVHNEEYRLYYQSKYKEVSKHQHKRALVLTARKLVRLVFALLTKNQLYQEKTEFSKSEINF